MIYDLTLFPINFGEVYIIFKYLFELKIIF